MRALVLLADTGEDRLLHDAAERAANALTAAGHPVDVRDLHAEGFGDAMTAVEREAYHRERPIRDPLVAEHAELVGEAQILVFVYPTLLSTMPPVMKAWLERVLVPGVGFVFDAAGKVQPGLLHVRRIVGISTYSERRLDVKVTHDNGRRTITRAVRMSAGVWVSTAWVPLYSAPAATARRRGAFLDRCALRVVP